MAKKPTNPKVPSDNALRQRGWVHECDILEAFGYSWSTWERNYRTAIPGFATPSGRWYPGACVDAFFMAKAMEGHT